PKAGADIVELGLPFSDPMADGPVIQHAGERALKAGGSVKKALEMVKAFRKEDADTPLVLMGYYNPIFRYGPERFVQDAAAAGADGMIVVDLPMEEMEELDPFAHAQQFPLIRLIAPPTPDDRLEAMMKDAQGFAYYIAVAGITGAKSADAKDLEKRVKHLKKTVKIPLAVGFGVKNPEQAKQIGKFADGVVVGSALVDTLQQDGASETLALVSSLAEAL
ncbi:MAG: tryptophan synthase subunit alpha, partial [Rickettsiales bacterium]